MEMSEELDKKFEQFPKTVANDIEVVYNGIEIEKRRIKG